MLQRALCCGNSSMEGLLSLQHRLSCHLRQSIQLESWALGLWGAALVNASIFKPEQHSLCLAGGFPDASSWAFERGQWANIWSFCFVLLKVVLIKFLKIVDDDWPCEMLNLKIFFQCACEKIHVHVCSVPDIETGSFARVCHLVGKKVLLHISNKPLDNMCLITSTTVLYCNIYIFFK